MFSIEAMGQAEVFHKNGDFAAFLDLMTPANERLPLRFWATADCPITFISCCGRTATET
jgi:hypothetical protein